MRDNINILYLPVLSIAKMELFANILSGKLCPGAILTLSGEVGAGKTTFARALITSLAPGVQVASPTFTLMQPYDVRLADGQKETLWHLDLYRLKQPEEAEALGLEELWPHITLMEWPEIMQNRLPAERLDISFDFGDSPESRRLALSGDETWQDRLKDISVAFL